jgi:peroxiredoxin Q/BCP
MTYKLIYKTMPTAPNFTLKDQNGREHSLASYKSRWVVLYFYPKDDTPGCTKEACGFRDSRNKFEAKDVEVFGISKDSVTSHKKFADKHALNFPILSDESLETIKAYNAWGLKKFMGKEYEGIMRTTVIISPEGEIVKTYNDVDPIAHAREVLHDIQELKSAQ